LQKPQYDTRFLGEFAFPAYAGRMNAMISDLLDMMRVRSTAYVGKNLTAPWGVRVSRSKKYARFHMVMAGETWVRLEDDSPARRLELGDVVILPHLF